MACFLRGRFGPGPNPKDCENLLQDSQNKSSVSNLDSNFDVLSLFALDFYGSSLELKILKYGKNICATNQKVFSAFNVRTNHFYIKYIFAVLNCRQSKTLKHTPRLKVASLALPSISVDL